MLASLRRMLVITGVSALAGAVYIEARTDLPWLPDMDAIRAHEEFRQRVGVTLEEFTALIAEGAIVVDARSADAFERAHLDVFDILNIPVDDIDNGLPRLDPDTVAGRPIVLYCASLRCDDAEEVYRALEERYYYPEMSIYFPGWRGIEKARLKTVGGPDQWYASPEEMSGEDAGDPNRGEPAPLDDRGTFAEPPQDREP